MAASKVKITYQAACYSPANKKLQPTFKAARFLCIPLRSIIAQNPRSFECG